MTTKDLSRELCEICGIEAKQFTKDFKTREKAASFGRKITGIPKFRGNKFDIGSYTDNQSIYQVHWKEFPDFTQPENFVILQKKLIQELGMGFDVQLWDYPTKLQIRFCWDDENFTFKVYGNSLEEVFLRFAIQICELNEDGDIKQAIRETEWVCE